MYVVEIYSAILKGGLSINCGLGGGFFLDWFLFNCAMKAWQTAFSESKGTWHGLSFTRALGFVLFIALIHFFLALKGPGRQFKGSSFLKASCFLSSCSSWCRFSTCWWWFSSSSLRKIMSLGRTEQQFSSSNSIDGSLSRLELGHSNCATASSPDELSAATDDVDWGDLKQIK